MLIIFGLDEKLSNFAPLIPREKSELNKNIVTILLLNLLTVGIGLEVVVAVGQTH